MRIGIFTDTYLPDINGVVSSIVTLKGALEDLGHQVFVITNHSGSTICREGDILRLPGIELKRLYGYKMSSPFQLTADRYIRDMNLDVIHVQTEYGVAIYGRQVARDFHIPLVYTYHTMWENYTHYFNPMELTGVEKLSRAALRSISRTYGNGGQAVIAPSQKTKEALLRYGVITPIYVVPTGLDLSRFDMTELDPDRRQKLAESLGLKPEDHIVLFVGRLAKEKMLEMVIDAVIQSDDEHIRLLVVGSGPDEAHYHEMARERGAGDRIIFTGRVESEDVPYYYGLADCFASASTSETQGMTYIEALAAGLPVFGRRDPVLEDLVTEGITGYYFDDARELTDKLGTFFDEDHEGQAQACIAKTRTYTREIFGSKVSSVYEQAVADYAATYDVEKMRAVGDFMYLTLQRDADQEPLKLLIPMDDFFDLKIGLQARLDAWVVTNYLQFQNYYRAWMAARKKLSSRDMTAWQLKDWLVRRRGLDTAKASAVVEEFTARNYLDDQDYAQNKAAYWQGMGSSRKTIRRKLLRDGLEAGLVESVISQMDPNLEYDSARKAALGMLKTMKAQSARYKRQLVVRRLENRGFSPEIARQTGEDLELEQDDGEALQHALDNAARLYISLEEDKRKEKILQYCLRQGFTAGEVQERLPDVFARMERQTLAAETGAGHAEEDASADSQED